MPLTVFSKRLFKDRVDFAASLTEKEVIELVRDKDLKVLQCADPKYYSQNAPILN
jgi:hypothetical protein